MRVRDVITQVRNIVQDTDATKYRYPDEMLVGYVNMAVQSIAVARPDLFACLDWVDINDGSVTVRAPRDSIRIIEVNSTRVLRTSARYVTCDDNGEDDDYYYGVVLAEIDVKQLNRATPGWRRMWQRRTANAPPKGEGILDIQQDMIPREYARNVRNPDTVFIHPGIPVGVEAQIELEYACSPRVITLEQVVEQTGNEPTTESGVPGHKGEMVWPDEIELLPDSYFPIVVDGSIFLVEAMEDEAVNSRRAEVFLNKFNAALGITASSRILTDTLRAGLPEGSVVQLNTGDRTN